MRLETFVNLVLPDGGKKCWVALKAKDKTFRRQGFVDTHAELAAKLQQLTHAGMDAYFACAAFKTDESRRSVNALSCKSFWLDIDCGEGKPYASADTGIQAADEFSNKLDIPLPLVVRSGSGIHCYWLLSETLLADAWLQAAKAFKILTEQYGLQADPTRTADLASILRPPETLNFKYDPAQPVSVDEGEHETITPQAFMAKLGTPVAATRRLLPVPSAIANPLAASILGGKAGYSMTQGYPDGQRTQALAARAGYLLAKGHDVEDVLAQCRAWNQYNTPPKDDAALEHDVRSYAKRDAEKRTNAPPIAAAEEARPRPPLPEGYSVTPGGAMFALVKADPTDAETKDLWVPISAYELYLVDVCRREREAQGSYVFYQFHPHNGWHQFIVSTEEFESSHWLAVMAKYSTDIINGKLFKQYVRAAAIAFKRTKMDAIRYEQFGWKENYQAFLVGNALIRRGGDAVYAYGDSQLEPRMQYMKLTKGTSLSEWSRAANRLYAIGFEAHGFSLLASFAAPLMTFVCGATDGGAVLALHSQGSGFGKSNILQAIASVWGQFDGLSTSGSDTENAKFNIISKACHLPVYEEELDKMDPIKAAGVLKRFVEGRDKNRAQRDGAVAVKNTRFQTIMISASNHSLFEILRRSGDQGAMARVLEIDFEVPGDKEAFKEFSRNTGTMLYHSGHAGRAFIFTLLQEGTLEWARRKLDDLVGHYQNIYHTEGKDRYIVYLMATCAVAAAIVNSAGILNFDVGRIMAWAQERAATRIEEKLTDTPIEMLNRFIAEHAEDCLTVQRPFNAKRDNTVLRFPRNKIMMRMERETRRLYIPSDTIRRWCIHNHYNYMTLVKSLETNHIVLNKARMTTLTAGTDFPNARVAAWEIAMDAQEMSGGLELVAHNDEPIKNQLSI